MKLAEEHYGPDIIYARLLEIISDRPEENYLNINDTAIAIYILALNKVRSKLEKAAVEVTLPLKTLWTRSLASRLGQSYSSVGSTIRREGPVHRMTANFDAVSEFSTLFQRSEPLARVLLRTATFDSTQAPDRPAATKLITSNKMEIAV
jgi:hypothetical protein